MSALYNNGWDSRGISLGNPVTATPAIAVDISDCLGFSVGFEVLAGFAGPATMEFWAYPPLASDMTKPDLASGTLISEGAFCDVAGANVAADVVNLPATLHAGDYVWGRPRCFPEKFLGVKGASGDFAHISAVAVKTRLKAA